MNTLKRILQNAWTYALGVLFCFNPLTSFLVVGWTYRLMQRTTIKRWHVAAENSGQVDDMACPNWIFSNQSHTNLFKKIFGSLWLNIKTGLAAMLCTWSLTLPGCVLWLFSWYDGWNNSFHKGYEQAWVGPTTGWLGIVLFIAAMLYVPMAQARQAATGHWRRFYDFALVWRIAKQQWPACLSLACLYTLISIPVTLLKTAPIAFEHLPYYPQMTDHDVLVFLQRYFIFACMFVFPMYVGLRLLAARIYAKGVVHLASKGQLSSNQLAPHERQTLDRLGLLHAAEPTQRHPLIAVPVAFTSRLLRWSGAVALAMVWFTFVAQIYISEFINYHPVIGWLNQPLVQLPWFRYMP